MASETVVRLYEGLIKRQSAVLEMVAEERKSERRRQLVKCAFRSDRARWGGPLNDASALRRAIFHQAWVLGRKAAETKFDTIKPIDSNILLTKWFSTCSVVIVRC